MGIRKVKFDSQPSYSSTDGTNLSLIFTRNYASRDELGNTVQPNKPRYGKRKLLCSAPSLDKYFATGQAEPARRQVWGGRWSPDAKGIQDPCLVLRHVAADGGNDFVQLYRGSSGGLPLASGTAVSLKRAYPTGGGQTTPVVDLLNDGTSRTDPWEEPIAFSVADGLIVAACKSTQLIDTQSTFGSKQFRISSSLCWWNVANSKWELVQRLPNRQTFPDYPASTLAPGVDRGQVWMLSVPWCRARLSGPITDCFFVWPDYRNKNDPDPNADTQGGVLCLARSTYANGVWATPVNRLLYEITFPDMSKQFVPATAARVDNGMHTHGGALLFADGSDSTMLVLCSVGDNWYNNRVSRIERLDGVDGAGGWSQGPTTAAMVAEPDPVNGYFPPEPVYNTTTGWTAYEDCNGERRRVRFPRVVNGSPISNDEALWTPVQSGTLPYTGTVTGTLQHDQFKTRLQASSVIGLRVRCVAATTSTGLPLSGAIVNPIAKVTAFDATTGTLTLEWPGGIPNTSAGTYKVSGDIWADASMQFVAPAPLGDPQSVLLGGDENSVAIYSATFDSSQGDGPGRKFFCKILYGTPPEMRFRVPGTPNSYEVPNWNCLLTTCALPQEGKHYVAWVKPGSIAGWGTVAPGSAAPVADATTLLYSVDGSIFGDMFQPVDMNWTPSAFFGSSQFCVAVATGPSSQTRLAMLDVPTTRAWRPLGVSPGALNSLKSVQVSIPDGSGGFVIVNTIEIATGGSAPFGGNTVEPLENFPVGVPKCPSLGPLLRCTMIGSNTFGLWSFTPRTLPSNARIRVMLWVYVPGDIGGDPNEVPQATPGAGLRFDFRATTNAGDPFLGWYNSATPRSRPIDVRPVAGTGWVPVTLYLDSSQWINEGGTVIGTAGLGGPWALIAQVSSNEFVRQRFLMVVDSVVVTEATDQPECTSQPLRTPWQTGAMPDEKLTITDLGLVANRKWSVFGAMRIADNGADVFSYKNGMPGDRVAFTLTNTDGTSFIRVKFKRAPFDSGNYDNYAGKVVIEDHLGNLLELSGPTSTLGGDLFKQNFYFGKSKQILVGLAKTSTATGAIATHRVWISVGGSVVNVGEGDLANFVPTHLRTGDADADPAKLGKSPDTLEIFGFTIDNNPADSDVTASAGRSALQTLSFLQT